MDGVDAMDVALDRDRRARYDNVRAYAPFANLTGGGGRLMAEPEPAPVAQPAQAPGAGSSRPSVVARRATWSERRPDLTSKLLALMAPVVLLAASAGFGWAAWNGLAEHTGAGFGFALMGMAALALLAFGDLYGAGGWWYCPCPVCGHAQARDFYRGQPAACGACLAYLRVEDGRVSEELDYAVEFRPIYGVRQADLAGRDPRTLQFPEGCSLCSAPATERREIRAFRFRQFDRQIAELTGPAEEPASPLGPNDFDWGLTAPVCQTHLHDTAAAVETYQDELQFRSYARYRAFCRLNGIEKRARP